MKVCEKCKGEKDETAFAKNRSRPDGLQRWCRDCFAAIRRERKKEAAA